MRNRIALALLFATALPAGAHVTLVDPNAKAGSNFVAEFRVRVMVVPGSAHHRAHRHPPPPPPPPRERSTAPSQQPKAGWTLSMTRARLDKPVAGEGGPITERGASITWTGGSLPADQFDEFSVMVRLPDTAGVLNFPVLQTCQKGAENWAELPDGSGKRPAHPAASLTVTAKDAAP